MNPLAWLALLGLGTLDITTSELEAAAALEISDRLESPRARVQVRVVLNGLEGALGHLDSATITASGFSVKELPFYTEPWRSKYGRVGTLRIVLTDFSLAGLHVQELSASVPDCRYDRGLALDDRAFRISRSGTGWGSVTINELDLADFILKRSPNIERATVRVFSDVVWIEGTGTILISKTDFTVVGRLSTRDGFQIDIEPRKVFFGWQRADQSLLDAVARALNPVIDISRDLGLGDALTIYEISLRDGVLRASGPARIPIKTGGPPTDNKG